MLDANRAGIDERDLKAIDVSRGSGRIAYTLRHDDQQTAAIREQPRLNDSEAGAIFFLIGKAGSKEAREHGSLDLASWFALIDALPMRRDEIRRRGTGRK